MVGRQLTTDAAGFTAPGWTSGSRILPTRPAVDPAMVVYPSRKRIRHPERVISSRRPTEGGRSA